MVRTLTSLTLLLLPAVAHCTVATSWTPTVGVWNGSLPALPQTSGGNLPHSPMLGNGYMGVQLATERASPSIVNDSVSGLAAPQRSLHLYIGSNAMWGIYPALKPTLGPTGKGTRRAVGGTSLSGLDELLGSNATFAAEQRIVSGELHTTSESTAGAFTTVTRMNPYANALTLSCNWAPSQATQERTIKNASVNLTLSVWALNQYPGTPPGQHDGPFKGPALLPTSSSVLNGTTLIATREAVPADIKSPRRIKVALAATVQPPLLTGLNSVQAADADPVTAASGFVSVHPSKSFSFTVLVAMADNLHSPTVDTTSLGNTAARLAEDVDASALATSASEWWAEFWARSFVHVPTQPSVEALWNGAQYILACSASADVDAATPAPGLGGPFVTSDNSGWNGDYTLDYNYEASYYGVYSSGHPELAKLYWAPMVDGMAAARRGAVDRAKAHNLSNCAPTALHYNAHISPWGFGDFDEDWESKSGQHMMWNGAFGALLFINDLEYLGSSNKEFFTNTTLPLLEGLLDWWACYLVKTPCSPAGTEACPVDGWRYDDIGDAVNEGTKTMNSQLGLAFVARLADVLRGLPAGSSHSTAIAKDIAKHLAPFDTSACLSPQNQTLNETVWVTAEGNSIKQSGMFAMYPMFPTEFLSVATATPSTLATAQASARVYCDLAAGRPVEVFAATVLSRSGASDIAWTAEDVIAGLKAQMHTSFGPNLLCDTAGGGIENVGMSRAVSEMLLSAPSGQFIEVFPFWPKGEPAAFGGLMAKGGFRLWANYTNSGVSSPVTLKSIAGAPARLLNPWPGQNATVVVRGDNDTSNDSMQRVSVTWVQTSVGLALEFETAAGENKTYIISKKSDLIIPSPAGDHIIEHQSDGQQDIACTMFSGNCTTCMAANDTRKDWASPCVFLSGPSEGNATCQPSKWWTRAAGTYPHVHACASCTQPASACAPLPPPPEGTCPLQKV